MLAFRKLLHRLCPSIFRFKICYLVNSAVKIFGSRYLRIEQVKFVKDSL